MGSVYWIGSNGNTYVKTDGYGVQDYGKLPGGATIDGSKQIADPNPQPQQSQPSRAPAGGGGGGAAAPPALNEGAVRNTQLTIDQLPAILQAALESEAQKYQNSNGLFDAQEGQQRKSYDEGTVTNQQNYDSNYMDSIRAGIKGLGGLMQLLRGSGAAGGSAEKDVRDTVGGVTSNDIRQGADTQQENQGQLDTSLSTFLTDLGLKRKQNEDTHVNNERSLRRDNDTQLQDLFGKMAGYYGDAGRAPEASSWLDRAGSLTPSIAANSASKVSPYDTTPVVVHAPNLTAFAEPTQPNVVTAPSDGQVGSGIFSMTDRRRDKEAAQQAPALAGA